MRTFGGEYKEAGSTGAYDTEKKEEDALTAKTLLLLPPKYQVTWPSAHISTSLRR